MLGFLSVLVMLAVTQTLTAGGTKQDVSRVAPQGELPPDARLQKQRNLRDEYHPWKPATSKQAWEVQAEQIRRRVLVSNGLWPMPPSLSLKSVIHGMVDRGTYTIQKVYFASHPGHYVTGSLYRPAKIDGKAPGILSPHGHWRNGRFYDAGGQTAKGQVSQQAEQHMAGARYPLQARMVQLAKMGCIVFHYDMVGRADSQQIGHSAGFTDVEAGLRLQNFMGLQTFNSIRALDFLLSLPDVDPKRIGVTGASGGGTQTFMLGAIDLRPTVAFPAVMVSTAMQGGCVCENAEYLRIGINNIALAALFAPRPVALSGANDWTVNIETRGYPELKQVYSHYGKTDLVYAKAYPHFSHNYNQVSRQMMYEWFNRHLKLGATGPIIEEDFWPVETPRLSVFDDKHKLPADAKSSAELREYLTSVSQTQFQKLLPKDADGLAEYKRVVGGAARVILDVGVPAATEIETSHVQESAFGDTTLTKGFITRKGSLDAVPFVKLTPNNPNGTVVLWIDGSGKSTLFDKEGQPTTVVQRLLKAGRVVVSVDVLLTGEFLKPGEDAGRQQVNKGYHGYTFGYNRPLLSNRVRDILTVIGWLKTDRRITAIKLVGSGAAGPWTMLAAGLAGDAIDAVVADAIGFGFANVEATSDPMFLPGALKYGGLAGLTALAAPTPLTIGGTEKIADDTVALSRVYAASKAKLTLQKGELTSEAIVELLLK
jgi:dienelactone hydrolase